MQVGNNIYHVLSKSKYSPCKHFINKYSQNVILARAKLKNIYCNDTLEKVSRSKHKFGMLAWNLNSFGDSVNALKFSNNISAPIIKNSNEVLVQVAAASVNPLDVEMISGFGSVLLRNMRKISSLGYDNRPDFPLILGRDFSGVVIEKGSNVENVNIGDKVYGVVKPMNQGCHSQFVVTQNYLVSKQPDHLTFEQASCLLYAGITAWCALKISANLTVNNAKGKRVLVIGSSGGVGSSAVQLLNAWHADVISVCSKDAVPIVETLSPNHIIDYTEPDYMEKVQSLGKYDIVLDAAGLGDSEMRKYIPVLNKYGSIVTLRSPLLSNVDTYGLIGGTIKSGFDLALPNITSGVLKKCSFIKWGFFVPSATAVKEISKLVQTKKITPIIDTVYEFNETPNAFLRLKQGHVHGKLVISINSEIKCVRSGQKESEIDTSIGKSKCPTFIPNIKLI